MQEKRGNGQEVKKKGARARREEEKVSERVQGGEEGWRERERRRARRTGRKPGGAGGERGAPAGCLGRPLRSRSAVGSVAPS